METGNRGNVESENRGIGSILFFFSFLSFGTLKLPAIVARQTERLVLYFCGNISAMLFARTHVDCHSQSQAAKFVPNL